MAIESENEMPGLHAVKRQQKDGSTKTHFYAWRGGPKITGDTNDELYSAYVKATNSFRAREAKKIRIAREETRVIDINRVYQRIVDNARSRSGKRGSEFLIDVQTVKRMIDEQNGKCAVSGIRFDVDFHDKGKFSYNPYGISIDRINCQEGYTPKNVRLVLTAVNFAMNEWGEDIFMHIARHAVAKELVGKTP